jgi:hypothetical protein
VSHDWTPLVEDGIRYEFGLKMRPEDESHPLFRWVRGLGRMQFAGPCTSIYRVIEGEDKVDTPQAVLVLAVTPTDPGRTLLSWRVLARRPSTNPLLALPSRVVTELVYRYFRLNVFLDLHVIQTMHRVDRPLWVAADGASVRAYRSFYDRNLIDTPAAFRRKSRAGEGLVELRPRHALPA